MDLGLVDIIQAGKGNVNRLHCGAGRPGVTGGERAQYGHHPDRTHRHRQDDHHHVTIPAPSASGSRRRLRPSGEARERLADPYGSPGAGTPHTTFLRR